MLARIKRALKSKDAKIAIPFLLFMVGGSFGLKQFTELRYQFRKTEILNVNLYDECTKAGIKMKPPEETTLEKEYDKYKQLDIDSYELKRVPRPWDENEI